MNFENTNDRSSINLNRKLWCTRSAALSFSLLLGACAATGNKEEPIASVKEAPVKEVAQKQETTPAPTAAELMKTLKAPLVEPPAAKVEPVKVVKEKPAVVAVKEIETKTSAEQLKKQEEKVVEPVKAEVKSKVVEVAPPIKEIPVVKQDVVAAADTSSSIDAKPFNVSAKKLPFTYDVWTIRQGNTPLTKGLVIMTPTWEMGKEGYMSQIWFTLMEDKIHVNSSSDIEPESKGMGIRIDGGDLIPFTSIAENNIGVISGKWLDQLAAANKVDVYLGFFPGKKPTSDTFTSDLSLNNLARMVATYRMLNQ